jgi:hypothetical protein
VPEVRPYFGLTHVAFVDGREKIEDDSSSGGLYWHRVDLRPDAAALPSVRLWPSVAGRSSGTPFEPSKQVLVAALSNDGERLALRDPEDATRVDVWESGGGRVFGLRPYGQKPVEWVSWSATGRLLTLGDGKLTGWEIPGPRAVFEVAGRYQLPAEPVRGRAWVALAAGRHVDLVDTATGRCLGRLAADDLPDDPYRSLGISPDGKLLAVCCRGNSALCRDAPFQGFGLVRTWDLATGRERQPVVVQRFWGRPIFVPDDKRVLLAYSTYDLASRLPAGAYEFYGAVGLGPDGNVWTLQLPQAGPPPRPAPHVRGQPPAPLALPPAEAKWPRSTLRPVRLVPAGQPLEPAWLLDKRSPIAVEADLGDAGRSADLARNMASLLAKSGFTVGPGGWRVKADCREAVTQFSPYARWVGNQPVPAVEVNWHLVGPDGTTVVWDQAKMVQFDTQSRYFKGSKSTGKTIGKMEEVQVEFDFGGRNPREAILEELYEKSVNLLMELPPARYYPHDKRWLELPVKGAVEPVN